MLYSPLPDWSGQVYTVAKYQRFLIWFTMMATAEKFCPPLRQGVGASQVYLPAEQQYPTTYAFLVAKFPHISAEEWLQRFNQGLILSQSGTRIELNCRYLAAQHIYYYRQLPTEIEVPFEHQILYENEEFLVVDKPHFLCVSPTGQYVQQTLLSRLKASSQNPELSPIHRLDRETAGLILISKNAATRGVYQQLFANKQIQKHYHAIAAYAANLHFPMHFSAKMQKSQPFYTMQIVAGEANSHTMIEIINHDDNWAKYKLTPITGKQHQLRVHMHALGLPLKNDRLYPIIRQQNDQSQFNYPLQLLAKTLHFIDPLSKQQMYFESNRDIYL